jgi:hypothetical protein
MKKWASGATIIAALMAVPTIASASTVDWATWSSASVVTDPTAGSATGATADTTFTYKGELENFFPNYPSYGLPGTFSGGTVSNPPPPGIIQLYGGNGDAAVKDTITFAKAVTNPVFAIWSLGQGGITASFDFNRPFTIQSGGPSAEYGGSSIFTTTPPGNDVFGIEGNGTIQFIGTFDSISWTNPTFENWYGFTVGTVDAVPEPSTWAMLILGFMGLGYMAYRRNIKAGLSAAA